MEEARRCTKQHTMSCEQDTCNPPLVAFLNYLSPPAGFDIPENTSVVCIAYGLESAGQACVQIRLIYNLQENGSYLYLRKWHILLREQQESGK